MFSMATCSLCKVAKKKKKKLLSPVTFLPWRQWLVTAWRCGRPSRGGGGGGWVCGGGLDIRPLTARLSAPCTAASHIHVKHTIEENGVTLANLCCLCVYVCERTMGSCQSEMLNLSSFFFSMA